MLRLCFIFYFGFFKTYFYVTIFHLGIYLFLLRVRQIFTLGNVIVNDTWIETYHVLCIHFPKFYVLYFQSDL